MICIKYFSEHAQERILNPNPTLPSRLKVRYVSCDPWHTHHVLYHMMMASGASQEGCAMPVCVRGARGAFATAVYGSSVVSWNIYTTTPCDRTQTMCTVYLRCAYRC